MRLSPAHWPLLLPTAMAAVLLALPGWSSLDYHATLVLTPAVFVSCGLWLAVLPTAGLPVVPLFLGGALPCLLLAMGDLWQVRCDRWTGLGFALLGPLLAPWLAAGVARLTQLLFPHWPRVSFVGLTLLLCVPGVWQFVAHPQVFGYGTPIGFVAGAIYEDAVDLHPALWAFRALDVAVWLPWAALSTLAQPWSLAGLVAVVRGKSRCGSLARAALGISLLGVWCGWHESPRYGWRVSTTQVQKALPVSVELDGFEPPVTVHLPAGVRLRRARRHAVRDAQWRVGQMQAWFSAKDLGPVDLYLYPNAAAKQRLMGARNVEIAKPWLRQVHLVLPEPGASVLTHELAHVYAGAWADSWLGVPVRFGVVPQALLIEGLAVAAEWPTRGELNPHQWAAAMLQKQLAQPLTELANPAGFLGTASDTAYTLAGSFLRWLADTHGKTAVHKLYASGDWNQLPGGSLARLEADWKRFLLDEAAASLTDRDRERALARFDRPGLFARPCLLATGRCSRDAQRLWVIGRPQDALARWQNLIDQLAGQLATPLSPDLQSTLAEARFVAGEQSEGLAALDALLAGVGPRALPRLQRAGALVLRGDLYLQQGKVTAAEADWAQAAREPISEDALRTLAIKTHMARHPASLVLAQTLLAEGHEHVSGAPLLAGLERDPALAMDRAAAWLWGRWRLRHVDWPTGGLGPVAGIGAGQRAVERAALQGGPLDCEPVVSAAEAERLLRRAALRTLLWEATQTKELDRLRQAFASVWGLAEAQAFADAAARLGSHAAAPVPARP